MANPPSGSQTISAQDALLRVYFEKRAAITRFLAARTRSLEAAEDLTQELYLKLATRTDLSQPENPEAFLYRTALNLMLDRGRGETRTAARDADWRALNRTVAAGQELADEPPADEVAASRQRLRQLVEAVAELPPQMQRAFRLHKLEGMSHAQTAQAMGLSVKSVEKHISSALRALGEKLGK